MSDKKEQWVDLKKGYVPLDEDHYVQGGYQPETSEAGPPPSGGGGGSKTSDDKEK